MLMLNDGHSSNWQSIRHPTQQSITLNTSHALYTYTPRWNYNARYHTGHNARDHTGYLQDTTLDNTLETTLDTCKTPRWTCARCETRQDIRGYTPGARPHARVRHEANTSGATRGTTWVGL